MKTRFFNKIKKLLDEFDHEMEHRHFDESSRNTKNAHLRIVLKLINYANKHKGSTISKMMDDLLTWSNNEESICNDPKTA